MTFTLTDAANIVDIASVDGFEINLTITDATYGFLVLERTRAVSFINACESTVLSAQHYTIPHFGGILDPVIT